MRGIRFIPWIALVVFLLSAVLLMGQTVNVTMWQNDPGRTGQNLSEATLTPGKPGDGKTRGQTGRSLFSCDQYGKCKPIASQNPAIPNHRPGHSLIFSGNG
jgi:hypothetical protein